MKKEILLEALKEMFRVTLLAMIPVALDGLIKNSLDLNLVLIAGAISALRFLDKLLHEIGKDTEKTKKKKSIMTKGLTRF